MTWSSALAWTLAVEVPIVVELAAALRWAPGRLRLVTLAAVGASLMTQPIAWIADGELSAVLAPAPRWIGLETAVIVIEAVVYVVTLRLCLRRALLASVVSNAASFGVGLAISLSSA